MSEMELSASLIVSPAGVLASDMELLLMLSLCRSFFPFFTVAIRDSGNLPLLPSPGISSSGVTGQDNDFAAFGTAVPLLTT